MRPEVSDIHQIEFTDIYLGSEASWLSGVPMTSDPIPVPESCSEQMKRLRTQCDEIRNGRDVEDFNVQFEGVSYRASIMQALRENVYVLRRAPAEIPPLESLGIPSVYIRTLMQKGLRGLVVVAGAFGQGKTTTASALLAARIAKFGGVAVCIEDPPELPLEGRRGEGVIYQRQVERGGFAHECRQVARWSPSAIFVGEVRDKETAAEALRASINGRLVICTIHSYDAATAIDRIYSLAGGNDDVASLMSNGIVAVLHQQLIGEPKRPLIEFLSLQGDEAVGARNLIRMKRFEQLGNEIQIQRTRSLMSHNRQQETA